MAQSGSVCGMAVNAFTVWGKWNECSIARARSNCFCASGVHVVWNRTLPSLPPLTEVRASSWARAKRGGNAAASARSRAERFAFMEFSSGLPVWMIRFLPMRPLTLAHAAGLSLAALFAAVASAQSFKYPESPRKAVTDSYHGIPVADDYRWLEDGKDPAVRAWSLAQLEVTRAYLDGLAARPKLKERFAELYRTSPVRYYAFSQHQAFFAMKRQPPRNQPMLVMMKSAGEVASERILVDPNQIDAKGTTAIDWYAASLDARYVAVALSQNGSEDGSAHVIDTRTGKRLADVVPRVQYPTGGGSFAWDAKSTGFYYTRYPQGNERPKDDANFYQQVWFHKLGTPAKADTYVIGKEFPRIAETVLSTTRDGKYVLAAVANGDGGEYAFNLRDPKGAWTKFADFADKIRGVSLGFDGRLYALSVAGAPHGK